MNHQRLEWLSSLPRFLTLFFMLPVAMFVSIPVALAQATICRVDSSVVTPGSGESWDTAYQYLQDALNDPKCNEIWLATGVYYPDNGASQSADDPMSSFQLSSGIAIFGGFAGTESSRDRRDWQANRTVLSGDIDGNDVTDANGVLTTTANIVGANAYHVIVADGANGTIITSTTQLDGVTVTGGQANGDNYNGGGFYCDGENPDSVCSPTLSNVTFSANWAGLGMGGAMYNNGLSGSSNPTLTNVHFFANSAYYGGAIYNDGAYAGDSSPTLSTVAFTSNTATYGGALYNNGDSGRSSPILTNSRFFTNAAGQGGAIYNNGGFSGNSSPQLIAGTFLENSAQLNGGAIYNFGSFGDCSPIFVNVRFSANVAQNSGGAVYNNGYGGNSSPRFTNVTFFANQALQGGALYNEASTGNSTPLLTNVTFSANSAQNGGAIYSDGSFSGNVAPLLTNAILWNNMASNLGNQLYNVAAKPTISYTLIASATNEIFNDHSSVIWGDTILNADPLFVDAAAGDLYLQSASPAIDGGLNSANPAATDLRGNPRINGSAVDLGSLENSDYSVITHSTGSGSGSILSDPSAATYSYQTVVTVTASPNLSSTFAGWSGDCSGVGACLLTMDSAKLVTATFTLKQYNLSKGIAGTGNGVILLSPTGGVYDHGTVVTVTASPNLSSTFAGWSGDCSGVGACLLTIDRTKLVTAAFTLKQYNLSKGTAGTGNGVISLSPAGGVYDHGTVVTVTASPNLSSTFAGWSGDCSGVGACLLTMESAKLVTAAFTLKQYGLSKDTAGTGNGVISLSPAGGVYNHGTVVIVTASPNFSSTFAGWSGDCSGVGACQLTIDRTKLVTAAFTLKQYGLSKDTAGTGNGVISLSPAGGVYDHGTVVTVTASPNLSSTFAGWSGDCSGVGACQLTMERAKLVTATFTLKQYGLSTNTAGTGNGVISLSPAGGVYDHGTVVTVTASPNLSSTFAWWSGDCSGVGACLLTMERAKLVTATFTLKQYGLSTNTAGTGNGVISLSPAGGVYDHGTVVTVTASPALSTTFAGWSGDCSGSSLCHLLMDANKTVTASFTLSSTPPIVMTVERLGEGGVRVGAVITYQVTITNIGGLPIQLASIQGEAQKELQRAGVNKALPKDVACSAPVTLAKAAVHRCLLSWTVTGNEHETVNFVVTVNGTMDSQLSAVTSIVQVLILPQDDEKVEGIFLPLINR